jgi:hypothetical protein
MNVFAPGGDLYLTAYLSIRFNANQEHTGPAVSWLSLEVFLSPAYT